MRARRCKERFLRRRAISLISMLIATTSLADTVIPNVIVTKPKLHSNGPKTLITKDQITASGVTTLSQALQNLGGVQLLDTTGNGSQTMLSLRGFGANASSNTLLLINGIPLTNPDMAPPDLNAIPINEIESIEVIAGSESVTYGDQAVGGIITINTREHVDETLNISCTQGSFNQYKCLASVYHQRDQLRGNATLQTNHTDNYREHNDFDQNSFLGGIRYDYASGFLKFNFNLIDENMQYPGALTAAQVSQNRRQATNDTDFFKDLNGFLHLRQQQSLNSNWNALTDMAYRRMNGNGVLTSPFTQSRSSFFIKPQVNGKVGPAVIKAGVDGQTDGYQLNSLFGSTNDRLQKYGLFASSDILLAPRFTLSLGARGAQQNNRLSTTDSVNTVNRAFATTIGLSHQLTSDTNVYLRRAGSFRFPKADENASIPSTISSLKTQRGIAYETGIEKGTKKYSAKLGVYLLNLKDEITFDPLQTPQQPFGSNTNLDPTVRRGATLSGKYWLNDKLNVNGQYNYVNARFQSGIYQGKRIPLVSETVIRTGLDWRIREHWQAYTDAIFTGNQFAANDNANIAKRNGGYTVYNVNLRYDYLHFSAALHLNNISNKYYYFYSVYQPGMPDEFFYPAPGRSYTLTVYYAL